MLVAFFADVQGNAAALERVLEEIAARRPDHVVAAGDFIGYGPSPRRVLSLLAGRPIDLIRGPDDAVLAIGIAGDGAAPGGDGAAGGGDGEVAASRVASLRRMIGPQDLAAIATSPEARSMVLHERQLWFAHGSAVEVRELADPLASSDAIVAAISRAGLDGAQVIAFGSRAVPFVRVIDGRTIAGAGSVGLATGGDPRASFLMIRVESGHEPEVELVRVEYSIAGAARSMKKRLRGGEVGEDHAARHLGEQLGGLTESYPASAPDATGTALLASLLVKRVRDVYLDALSASGDWEAASTHLIHDMYLAARRLRQAITWVEPLVAEIPRARVARRVRRLERALEQRRAIDIAIRSVRAREALETSNLLRRLRARQKRISKRLRRKFSRAKMLAQGIEVIGLTMTARESETTLAKLLEEQLTASAERVRKLLPALDEVKGHRDLERAVFQLSCGLEIAGEKVLAIEELAAALAALGDARQTAKRVRKLGRNDDAGNAQLGRSVEHEAKARHRIARDLDRAAIEAACARFARRS